jgi:hypothetical protein
MMVGRFQVGSSYKTWKFVMPLLLTVLMVGIGAAVTILNKELTLVPLAIGGGFWLLTLLAWTLIARRRCWIELTDDGFILTNKQGEREYKDEDIRGICNWVHNNFSGGLLKSVTRYTRLWLDTGSGIEQTGLLKYGSPAGQECPLGYLKDRVIPKLVEREKAAIEAGKTVTGEGWELRKNELYVTLRKHTESVRTDDIAATGYWDQHLCIWKKGEEKPSIRFPSESKNLYVLAGLLEGLIPHREGQEQAPAGTLGRILFERKKTNCFSIFVMVAGVAGAIALAAAELYIPAAVGVIAGLIAGFWLQVTKKCFFRCHEFGVHHQGTFGENSLRYDEMASFSYGATRRFVNGVYQGTDFALGFAPFSDAGKKGISYTTTIKGQDEELETLREHISKVIAGRMATELDQGRPVQWTEGMRFLPDGIEHRPKKVFGGRKEPAFIPYSEVSNYYLHEGSFFLTTSPDNKIAIQEEVNQANFFPGFVLLNVIFSPPGQGQQEAPAQQA